MILALSWFRESNWGIGRQERGQDEQGSSIGKEEKTNIERGGEEKGMRREKCKCVSFNQGGSSH